MRTLISTLVAALVLAATAAAGEGSPVASGHSRTPKARLDPAPAALAATLAKKQTELHGQVLRATRTAAPEFVAPEPLVARSPASPPSRVIPVEPGTQVAQH